MLCTHLLEPDFPQWVLIFERLGPGSAILVFTGALLWKLLPAIVKLVIAWRRQSEEVTKSVPMALDGLRDLVQHVERIAEHVTGRSQNGGGGATIRVHRERPSPGAASSAP